MIRQNMLLPPAYKSWNKNDFLGYSLDREPHDLQWSGTNPPTVKDLSGSVSGRVIEINHTADNCLAFPVPHSDIDILCKLVFPATTVANKGYFGLWFRASNINVATSSMYALTLGTNGSNGFDVQNLVKYAPSGYGQTSLVKAGTKGSKLWVRVNAVGSSIKSRRWQDGSAEPSTWDQTWTQSEIASGNFIMVGTFAPGDSTNRTRVEYLSYALGSSATAPSP